MASCTFCGAKLEKEWSLCPKCGTTIPEPPANEKTTGNMKKKITLIIASIGLLIIVSALALVLSGGGDDECENPLMIAPGKVCCQDDGSADSCEKHGEDEETSADSQRATTTTMGQTATERSSQPTQTTTLKTSSTTIQNNQAGASSPGAITPSCVNKYGLQSNTLLYLYTKECCDPIVSDRVRAVERLGYSFRFIDIDEDELTDEYRGLLSCFLSGGDIMVPQFICPATKQGKVLTQQAGVQTQIKYYALECNRSAYGVAGDAPTKSAGVGSCSSSSVCGETKSEFVCMNGNVYLKKEVPSCRNPGTVDAKCVTSVKGLTNAVSTCGTNQECKDVWDNCR